MMEVAKYFPSLVWVLRDFSLDMYDENLGREASAKEYFESTLLINTKSDQDSQARNQIRNTIREYFRDRNCIQ
jgi:hypothetical protein